MGYKELHMYMNISNVIKFVKCVKHVVNNWLRKIVQSEQNGTIFFEARISNLMKTEKIKEQANMFLLLCTRFEMFLKQRF